MEYLLGSLSQHKQEPVIEAQTIKLHDGDSMFNMLGSSKITYDSFMNQYDTLDTELPLKVNIKTHGGSVSTFLSIAKVLSEYPSKTTIKIDRYAYSGGTVLCLVCDEIEMNKNCIMGAINPYILLPVTSKQIDKAQEKLGASGFAGLVFEYLKDMEACYITNYKNILSKKYTEQEIQEIIDFFVYKYDHGMPIYYEDLPQIIKNKIKLV